MKRKVYVAVMMLLGCLTMAIAKSVAPAADEGHVSTTMTFVVKASMQRAAPLFTPAGMQCWLGTHFQPEIVYAQTAKDAPGAVFTMQQGPQKSVWVNTIMDAKDGRMQYAMFVADAMVTIVDVRMISDGKDTTRVELTHTATALNADARAALKSMGSKNPEHIAAAQKAIEGCLATN